MPAIDYLLISYDHLDHATGRALRPKVKHVVCSLGVGAHFERWGYDPAALLELDWHDSVRVADGFRLVATSARHGSGRGLRSSTTQWLSFVLDAPSGQVFVSGDTGYDTHFAAIGRQYGPFDLAIVENGQYSDGLDPTAAAGALGQVRAQPPPLG